MSEDEFNEDELLAQVVPVRPTRAAAAPLRTFKPWHKPRKQWVRRRQWFDQTARLVADTHFPADSRIFRYLSMPGEDLLDIRILQEACAASNLELRFTGLNSVDIGSADDMQLNLSESAIRGLPTIHPGSKILREKFQAIADPQSLAHVEVRNSGPFNAINIDLCDHIALREQGAEAKTIIDALAEILSVQLERAMEPWLLFVTTRIGPGQVDADNLRALIQAVRDNVDASQDFEASAADLLNLEGHELAGALDAPNGLSHQRFTKLFCLAFGKWLLSYIQEAHPARDFQMLPSCYYSVRANNPDMLSLAYRCDVVRRPPLDAYGILPPNQAPAPAAEVEMALRLAAEAASLADLDALLRAAPDVLEEMTVESEALLRTANYPVDDQAAGYRAWLQPRPRPAARDRRRGRRRRRR